MSMLRVNVLKNLKSMNNNHAMFAHWEEPYKTENYDFCQSLNESYESIDLQEVIATKIYEKIIELIKIKLSDKDVKFIEDTCFMNVPFDKDNQPSPIKNGCTIGGDIQLEEYRINEGKPFAIRLSNEYNVPAFIRTNDNTIYVHCDNKNGYITYGSFKHIFETPDIIIHEIIHWLDLLRSDKKVLNGYNINKRYNSDTEINAHTHNLIILFNHLMKNGLVFNKEYIYPKEKLLRFLQNLTTNYKFRYIINYTVIRELIIFTKNVSDVNFKKMISDVAEYFQEKLKHNED